MQLVGNSDCYIVKDFFPSSIILGFTRGYTSGNIPQDIENALLSVGISSKVAYLDQKHSSVVNIIKNEGLYEGDALFTDIDKCALVVQTADCLPIFLTSSQLSVIGIIHMGWRSAYAGILDNIPYALGSFKAVAGVGLRSCCYEVGKELRDYAYLSKNISINKGRLFFDPISFTKDFLCSRGFSEDNFFDLGICSFCSRDNFFSYRKDRTLQRNLSFILKYV